MGFFSYTCKCCGHSILSSYSTDPEINEWMKDVVVLSPNGSRVIGEYDGYGRVGGGYEDDLSYDSVWLHKACWEHAGKPGYKDFDGPSKSAEDQGYFFKYEHDVIDPRITDLAERTRLLDEGKAARAQRWYDRRATDVYDWLHEDPKWKEKEEREEPWRQRFSYSPAYSKGKKLKNQWWLRDKFGEDAGVIPVETEDGDLAVWKGTEAKCKAYLAKLWAEFIESDECKAYVARAEELRDEARQRKLNDLKKEGRYKVSTRPAKGDTVKEKGEPNWVGHRDIYIVVDRMTHKDVAVLDGPNKALGRKTYQGKYPEKRIEAMRAAGRESCKLAKAEAKRLNKEWAKAGYPWEASW